MADPGSDRSAGPATVADLGEVGLVKRIVAAAGATRGVGSGLVGPGDDAAVIAAPDGRVVVTTDVLVQGRHFRTDWSAAEDIGHKAAAENLADLAAMGARPTALVVGLAMPSTTEVAWVDGLLAGFLAEAARAGASLAGGDVVRADAIVISVTALGDLEGRDPVLRSGARPGDVVALQGYTGRAAAGLAVLSRGFRSPRALVDAHRRPEPSYDSGISAAEAGATSLMDVSDGLLLDAARLAAASEVEIHLDSSRLAIDEVLASTAAAYNLDPLQWVLGGGDDHALLATFPPDAHVPEGFIVIGEVAPAATAGGPLGRVLVDGAERPAQGWDHFA